MAATGSASIFAAELPVATIPYPFVLSGAIAVGLATVKGGQWRHTTRPWPSVYAAASTSPSVYVLGLNEVSSGWAGLGLLGCGVVAALISWRNTDGGIIRSTMLGGTASQAEVPATTPAPTFWWERAVFAWAAVAFGLAGIAYLQHAFGVQEPQTRIAYCAIATLSPFALAVFPWFRDTRAILVVVPVSVVACLVSLPVPVSGMEGHATAFLALPGLTWLAVSLFIRRWSSALLGAGLLALATFPLRDFVEWPTWAQAALLAGAGLIAFLSLTRWRNYRTPWTEQRVGVAAFSWGFHGVAMMTCLLIALSSEHATETGEYRMLVGLVAALSLLIAFEGLRFGWVPVLVPAAGVGLCAALLATGLGAPVPVWGYPFVAAGLVLVGLLQIPSIRDWAWPAGAFPWLGAALCAIAPLVSLDAESDPGWSALGLWGSSLLLASIAWKNTDCGVSALWPTRVASSQGASAVSTGPFRTHWWERLIYSWGAVAFAMGGMALAQRHLGVSEPETGLVFAVSATLPAIALAAVPRLRSTVGLIASIPVSAVAGVLVWALAGSELQGGIYLAVPGIGWLAAVTLVRRWTLAVVGVVFLALSTFAFRIELGLPVWAHALLLAGFGLGPFIALTPWRIYRTETEQRTCVQLLSWGLHATALLLVVVNLLQFTNGRLETGRELFELTSARGDYRALTVLVAALAPMVALEGLRHGRKWILLPSSGIAMVGILMAIGWTNPANVQFYTVPLGLYFLAIGMWFRTSPDFIPPHIQWHEAALLLGVGCVVLPQVEQSFETGGALWGPVLIVEGLAFLALGLAAGIRWLVPPGILVLSGVAIRWMLETGQTMPYWLTLGLLGTVLLAMGMVVLLNNNWWSRTRTGVSHWWQSGY